MVDVPTIAGVLSALKTFKDLAVSLFRKVFQIGAQQSDMAAQHRVTELEKQLAEQSAWNAEKGRYELKQVSTLGTFAFVLKPEHASTEPLHCLCAPCFDRGKKSILQATPELALRRRLYVCPECKTTIAMDS